MERKNFWQKHGFEKNFDERILYAIKLKFSFFPFDDLRSHREIPSILMKIIPVIHNLYLFHALN